MPQIPDHELINIQIPRYIPTILVRTHNISYLKTIYIALKVLVYCEECLWISSFEKPHSFPTSNHHLLKTLKTRQVRNNYCKYTPEFNMTSPKWLGTINERIIFQSSLFRGWVSAILLICVFLDRNWRNIFSRHPPPKPTPSPPLLQCLHRPWRFCNQLTAAVVTGEHSKRPLGVTSSTLIHG